MSHVPVQKKNEEARKQVQAGRIKVGGQTETLSQADKDQVSNRTATAAHLLCQTHETSISAVFADNTA